MNVSIVNYGMGNTFSIKHAIENLGFDVSIANNPSEIEQAQKIILPGVGSFSKAMDNLNSHGWTAKLTTLVKEKKIPILGICLGMHLFANSSNEVKKTKGLSFIDGDVVRLDEIGCKNRLPHVGWNEVKLKKFSLVESVEQNSDFYFVHSYCYKNLKNDLIVGTTNYDVEIISIIKSDNIIGTQFHPEKSSHVGKKILKNFLEIS
jgi:imidazole glycerol-phosphate synthase subunit HisH